MGAGGYLRGQPLAGCLRRALGFVWGSALREVFNFFFQRFVANAAGILALDFGILTGRWAINL